MTGILQSFVLHYFIGELCAFLSSTARVLKTCMELFMFPSAMALLLMGVSHIFRIFCISLVALILFSHSFSIFFWPLWREVRMTLLRLSYPCHFPCSFQAFVSVYFICERMVVCGIFCVVLYSQGAWYVRACILFHVLKWEMPMLSRCWSLYHPHVWPVVWFLCCLLSLHLTVSIFSRACIFSIIFPQPLWQTLKNQINLTLIHN